MVWVWWKNVLCVLHRVYIYVLVYHLVIYHNLTEPLPAHRMVLLLNHLLCQTTEFFQVLVMSSIFVNLVNEFLFYFKNSSNYLSSFQLIWTLVNPFFLILNTKLTVKSGFFLNNISSVVAPELPISVKETRNLRGC